MNKIMAIVLNLSKLLLHKGHTLWVNHHYNTPDLVTFLKINQTDCVGTLRIIEKNPKAVKAAKL